MSIEKKSFDSTTAAEGSSEVFTWLKANASDLFDSITKEDSGNEIVCKKNGKKVLTLYTTDLGVVHHCRLYDRNETALFTDNALFGDSATNFECVYKTSHGIVLIPNSTNTDSPKKRRKTSLFVSTSENGELIFAGLQQTSIQDGNSHPRLFIIAPENEAEYTSTTSNGDNKSYDQLTKVSAKTAFCETLTKSGLAAPHLFYLPFVEYPETFGVIDDGTKKYVTDGFFALEE